MKFPRRRAATRRSNESIGRCRVGPADSEYENVRSIAEGGARIHGVYRERNGSARGHGLNRAGSEQTILVESFVKELGLKTN